MNTTLTEEQEIERGNQLVKVLNLKEVRDQNRRKYTPARYETTHGTKTALGLFRTLERIITESND